MKLLLLVLLIPVLIFSANSKIDSLCNKLETAESIERIELFIELSLEYVKIDTVKSLKFSNQALELSDQLSKHKAQAIENSGNIHYLIGNYETALKLLFKAIDQPDLENDTKNRADILKNIGLVYSELKKYDRSLEYLIKALNIYLELELKPDVSKVYFSIGKIYDLQDKYKKALQYYHKALLLDKELNDKNGMAVLYYHIGDKYELLTEYVKALESYFNCLKMYEELDDQGGIADSYNVIGNIFQALENNDMALEYYNKYLKIQKEMENKSGISIAYNNIGIVSDDNKDYDKALEYYSNALEIDKEINDKDGIATVTNNLGIVYYKLKDYDKALEYYQQSLSLSKELNDIWGIANTSNNIAELYLDLTKYTQAFSYVNKGFEYAESIEVKDLISESFHIYSKLYSKTNNYRKAFEYYKKYIELKDTLYTTSIRKVAEIQMIRETEKKEKENELLRKDNQIKDLQIEKQKNLRYSLFILILLAIFSFMIIFKRYQNKKKEHLLIIGKNKLITQQKKQLDHALKELKELNINLEKKVGEIKINSKRLTMLNKIVRHDLSNDFIVIRSALRLYKANSEIEMLDEIRQRVNKSLETIAVYKKYESFIDSNASLEEIEIFEVINNLTAGFPKINFSIKGKCKVFADDALKSVFTNLITNSINHGKASEIDIEISSVDTICKIKFRDNGMGIPNKIKDKIFDEGFIYGKKGHTGIGLYIVKEVIEEYGGTVSVENNKPKGAVFVINLKKVIRK